MKLLCLDQFSQGGGAQACLRDVLSEGLRRGWRMELMAPGNGVLHQFCREAGIESAPLPLSAWAHGRKSFFDIMTFPRDVLLARSIIARRVQAFRPHVVYVNGPRVLPAVPALPCPLVFHSHSLLNKGYSRGLVRWSLARNRVTAIAACAHVAQALPKAPVIIYNGVPDQGFVKRSQFPGGAHLGLIGRIAPEKGQLEFVLAARLLAASHPGIRFSIVGSTMYSDPAYETQVRRAAAGLPVEFRGWMPNVAEVLHQLDVLAVPSGDVDATPRVVMEALSAGTPIVAFRSGGLPELLQDGETARFAARNTPEALASALGEMLARPELMASLSAAGRTAWEQRFQLSRFQREVCDLLEAASRDHRTALAASEPSAVR